MGKLPFCHTFKIDYSASKKHTTLPFKNLAVYVHVKKEKEKKEYNQAITIDNK